MTDDDTPKFLSLKERKARRRAEENVERWGQQQPAALVLAMAEELGEMTEHISIEVDDDADWDDPGPRATFAVQQIGAVGLDVRNTLEEHFEDEDGPLDPEDRPSIPARVEDTDATREELYDLMALCYQLDWAIYQGAGDQQ